MVSALQQSRKSRSVLREENLPSAGIRWDCPSCEVFTRVVIWFIKTTWKRRVRKRKKIPCALCQWNYIGERNRIRNTKQCVKGSNVAKFDKGHNGTRKTLESWHTAKTVEAVSILTNSLYSLEILSIFKFSTFHFITNFNHVNVWKTVEWLSKAHDDIFLTISTMEHFIHFYYAQSIILRWNCKKLLLNMPPTPTPCVYKN